MRTLQYSSKTTSLASVYDLSVDELAFVDLIASGWDTSDAFCYTMTEEAEGMSTSAIDKGAREILARPGAKKRIRELRKTGINEAAKDAVRSAREPVRNDEDIMKQLSKESMLRDLYLARKKMAVGSKDWLDTNKMIADITRMKQEEVKTEDNTVHFYLPLTCNKCSLYIVNKQKEQEMLRQ